LTTPIRPRLGSCLVMRDDLRRDRVSVRPMIPSYSEPRASRDARGPLSNDPTRGRLILVRSVEGSTFVDELCHYHTAHLLAACVTSQPDCQKTSPGRSQGQLATNQGAGQHQVACHAPRSGTHRDDAGGGMTPTPDTAGRSIVCRGASGTVSPRGEPA